MDSISVRDLSFGKMVSLLTETLPIKEDHINYSITY